jgi:hypothetical protein
LYGFCRAETILDEMFSVLEIRTGLGFDFGSGQLSSASKDLKLCEEWTSTKVEYCIFSALEGLLRLCEAKLVGMLRSRRAIGS